MEWAGVSVVGQRWKQRRRWIEELVEDAKNGEHEDSGLVIFVFDAN
jgi:hypothetical protein